MKPYIYSLFFLFSSLLLPSLSLLLLPWWPHCSSFAVIATVGVAQPVARTEGGRASDARVGEATARGEGRCSMTGGGLARAAHPSLGSGSPPRFGLDPRPVAHYLLSSLKKSLFFSNSSNKNRILHVMSYDQDQLKIND